jgi:nucleosome binding factor SPN SPT16 subunit
MPQLKHSEWLMAFTRKCVYILSNSGKWVNLIKSVCDRMTSNFNQKIELLLRDKGDKNKANFLTIIQAVKQGGGTRLGCVIRDKTYGSFATTWESAIKQSGLEVVDLTDELWEVFSDEANLSKVGFFCGQKLEPDATRLAAKKRSMCMFTQL